MWNGHKCTGMLRMRAERASVTWLTGSLKAAEAWKSVTATGTVITGSVTAKTPNQASPSPLKATSVTPREAELVLRNRISGEQRPVGPRYSPPAPRSGWRVPPSGFAARWLCWGQCCRASTSVNLGLLLWKKVALARPTKQAPFGLGLHLTAQESNYPVNHFPGALPTKIRSPQPFDASVPHGATGMPSELSRGAVHSIFFCGL